MGIFNKVLNKDKNKQTKIKKFVRLCGVNCSYEMFLDYFKRYFRSHEINCDGDYIYRFKRNNSYYRH